MIHALVKKLKFMEPIIFRLGFALQMEFVLEELQFFKQMASAF